MRRYFTLERANRAIPLVRRIVTDLTEVYGSLQAKQKALGSATPKQRQEMASELFDLEGRMERHLAELESVGCELKDVETGLLDFYAMKGEDVILLCWRLGEERIEFWHELETGFGGRRPVGELPPETLAEPTAVAPDASGPSTTS